MKPLQRNLLSAAGLLIVLAGVFAALKTTEKQPETTSSIADDTAISLLSKQIEDVKSMQVKNKNGGFVIVPSTVGTSSGLSDQTTYVVQGLEGLPLYKTAAENVVKDGFSLIASKNVGSVSNLKEYGLDHPAAEVQVNFRDGTSFDYLLGNEAAGSDGYYMAGKNSSNVYVVSVDSGIFSGAKDFVKKELYSLTNASSGQETPAIEAITLTNTHLGEHLSISNKNNLVTVSDGKQTLPVDDTQYSTLATTISTVTADEVTAIRPSAELKKQYGLDAPSTTLSFTADKQSHTLKAGKVENGLWYVMADDIDAIYAIREESASVWANTTLFSLRSKFVQLLSIASVSGLDVTAQEKTFAFEKARTKNTTKSTADSEVFDYTVTCNGKAVTYEPNFQKYYQNIIAVQLLEEANADSDGVATAMSNPPVLTVRFRFYDAAKKPVTVQYYTVNDRRFLAVVDNVPQGLVTATNINGLVADTITVSTNGTVQAGL